MDISLYQGSDPFIDKRYITAFGKITAPLVHFLDNLKYKDLPYSFYQDNAFTSQAWLLYCRHRGYFSTGTVRRNRLPKGVQLASKLDHRGDVDFKTSEKAGIIVCKWQDNRDVIMASNNFGVCNPKTTQMEKATRSN